MLMKYLRFLLFPFSIIYYFVTTVRNLFFDLEIFKQTSFKTPIIVVGNLSVGGTGKTPQIEYLIRLLKNSFKTSVLSRGYGRKTKDFVLLNDTHNAIEVGDEPIQYFKKFNKIDVAVDVDRVAGVSKLIELKSPEIILLDDAFQHRKIKGSFYILLTKFNDLFTNDFLLPTGNLRESRRGAIRSDVIIITKCPENLNILQQEIIKRKFKKFKKEVFFTTISYGNILSSKNNITVEELKKYDVLLVTGIANPKPLLEFLSEKRVDIKHIKFSDHHNFSVSDIERIRREFVALKSTKKIILTTEKDYTRLEDKLENISYIEIETRFLQNQKENFDQKILSHIKQNRC